jgi:hypothetical protein
MTTAAKLFALLFMASLVAACGDDEQRYDPRPIEQPTVCGTVSCVYGSVVFDDRSSLKGHTSSDFSGLAGEYLEFLILVLDDPEREEPDMIVVEHDESRPNLVVVSPEVLAQRIEPIDGYSEANLWVRGGASQAMGWRGARNSFGSVTRTSWGVDCEHPSGFGTDDDGYPEVWSATCETGTAGASQLYPGSYSNHLSGRSWWRVVLHQRPYD